MKRLYCQRLEYPSFNKIGGACSVEIFDHTNLVVIIIKEIGEGVSVTNAAENIQTTIFRSPQFKAMLPHMTRENVVFIEHYPHKDDPTWDAVKCQWDETKQEFFEPVWAPVPMHVLKEYTGCIYPASL